MLARATPYIRLPTRIRQLGDRMNLIVAVPLVADVYSIHAYALWPRRTGNVAPVSWNDLPIHVGRLMGWLAWAAAAHAADTGVSVRHSPRVLRFTPRLDVLYAFPIALEVELIHGYIQIIIFITRPHLLKVEGGARELTQADYPMARWAPHPVLRLCLIRRAPMSSSTLSICRRYQ